MIPHFQHLKRQVEQSLFLIPIQQRGIRSQRVKFRLIAIALKTVPILCFGEQKMLQLMPQTQMRQQVRRAKISFAQGRMFGREQTIRVVEEAILMAIPDQHPFLRFNRILRAICGSGQHNFIFSGNQRLLFGVAAFFIPKFQRRNAP